MSKKVDSIKHKEKRAHIPSKEEETGKNSVAPCIRDKTKT